MKCEEFATVNIQQIVGSPCHVDALRKSSATETDCHKSYTTQTPLTGGDCCHHTEWLNKCVGVVWGVSGQHFAHNLVSPPAQVSSSNNRQQSQRQQ